MFSSKRQRDEDDYDSDVSLPYTRYFSPKIEGPQEPTAASARLKFKPKKDKFSKSLEVFRSLPEAGSVMYSEEITPATKNYLEDNFGVLYKKWGYRQDPEGSHNNYEMLLHYNRACYASCTAITDKLFRNLQQLCNGWPHLLQSDLNKGAAVLSPSCSIDTVKQFMRKYLEEDGVEAAMFQLANYDFTYGGSKQNGIMAALCAAARGFLFLSAGEFGKFNATRQPKSANECSAYIKELSSYIPSPIRGRKPLGSGAGTAGGRKRSQSRNNTKRRRSVRSGSRRNYKSKKYF